MYGNNVVGMKVKINQKESNGCLVLMKEEGKKNTFITK